MNRTTIKLLLGAALLFAILLVVIRGILPSDSTPSMGLIALPLVAIVLMIVSDMMKRSTVPTIPREKASTYRPNGGPAQLLRSHIKIAALASDSYFESVVRSHLRELLITKAIIETGLERDSVLSMLSKYEEGLQLIRDEKLYGLLYGPLPARGPERLKLIEEAIEAIRDWQI